MSRPVGEKKEPLSVEKLLERQKEAQGVRPRFLSKAERQAQAAQKAAQEEADRASKVARDKKERQELERSARIEGGGGRERDGRADVRDYRDSREQRAYERPAYDHVPTGPRGGAPPPGLSGARYPPEARREALHSHSAGPSAGNGTNHLSSPSDANGHAIASTSESIKDRYLGIKHVVPKKTRRQLNDKKFMFDHDLNEDTSVANGLDADGTSVDAQAVVRGRAAGMDLAERRAKDGLDPFKRGVGKSAFAEKHWKEKTLEEMKERDWRIFREDFSIAARGGHIPKPLRKWEESSIPGPILRAVAEIGYAEPSPIQRQAIPIGLQNRDLIGIAETGSGKTASFVIPMLSYISKLPRLSEANRHLGPYALVIAPTRELAQQIEVETKKFTDSLGYKVVSIVGGRDMNEQSYNLRDGAEIIVATPGRLKDCIERHVLVLSQCLYLVIDEADKCIGLGLQAELDFILDSMPASNLKPDTEDAENPAAALGDSNGDLAGKYRVTMLYSATMPASVERLARNYLRRPATITIGDANQAVGTVEQRVEFIAGEDKKKARLMQILQSGFEPPIIIFSTTKQSVDSLSRDLQRSGFNPAVLHSGKTQTQREEALASLRNGECPVLVATDLAGRGIDVPDVTLVINFSFPTMFEAYIHRIGRTGRAGKRGLAITFLEMHDEEFFYDLRNELARSPISTVPRDLDRHPSAQKRVTREMKRKRDEE
ncbi:putative U5 snRNP 100 kd protein [Ceraceosorus guamensis]|uniref:RNA helicase n=1 Tax=Ceraceosorus guamensis TaxID=1522189 RepID=A0A316VT33_9BASI|nr:putative U5 snRNP 100 kd protein [Ceraceosorus guamensis]PWN40384.1 putative U5 snRNP 100 kd protein [Ceraceosorus guamensis]